jgi:hypothetical protein
MTASKVKRLREILCTKWAIAGCDPWLRSVAETTGGFWGEPALQHQQPRLDRRP